MSEQKIIDQKAEYQDEPISRRQERRERIEQRREDRQAGGLGWVGGVILIVIGVLYLLGMYDILPNFTNWWAFFILLPAAGTFSAALGAYRRNGGEFTTEVVGPLVASLFFVALTAVFLFELNFSWVMPLFLIAAGVLLLFRSFFGQPTQ
ncbi:MAG: hypothetical protein WAM60_15290 [Candidatus Promineifilaceae bacterium]